MYNVHEYLPLNLIETSDFKFDWPPMNCLIMKSCKLSFTIFYVDLSNIVWRKKYNLFDAVNCII